MDDYEKAEAWIMGTYDVTKDKRYAKYPPLEGTITRDGIMVWWLDRKLGQTVHAELDVAAARSWAEQLLWLANHWDEWKDEYFLSKPNLVGPVEEGAERGHEPETR